MPGYWIESGELGLALDHAGSQFSVKVNVSYVGSLVHLLRHIRVFGVIRLAEADFHPFHPRLLGDDGAAVLDRFLLVAVSVQPVHPPVEFVHPVFDAGLTLLQAGLACLQVCHVGFYPAESGGNGQELFGEHVFPDGFLKLQALLDDGYKLFGRHIFRFPLLLLV